MKPGQRAELSMTTYQLAEQYRVGSPIALYNMQPWWIHFCQVIRRVLLGIVNCAISFVLVAVALFFYQYRIVYAGQIPDLQDRLILSLPGTIVGLLGCSTCILARNIIAEKVPASFLVCTKGLLEIRPQEVDVTYWNDVKGILESSELRKKKLYKLERISRKPLLFGETFEDVEDLASLIRQQIQGGAK